MDLREWSKSNANYSRRLVRSGFDGFRSAGEEFLNRESPRPFLGESVRSAMIPAALGTCIGVLSSSSVCRQKSPAKAVAFGLLGALVGLSAGLAWESRLFATNAAGSALRSIARVRDEHWLTKHPIDYA